ncbi:3-dehydroquinate synthase [Bacillus sp. FJAT-50079]|uniref:3-dehydroquinate synthase n=1 Tax=Bacillus sp. FJAT-50079 TaxID=2833577 RepID=UPI001BC96AD2|nr:3-dehydroquinate synthase [Bacillus sp. FJAT-50079]MBS4209769.1 3-dehydroquinate synthase [Bacillus sp. FJAT-50079]
MKVMINTASKTYPVYIEQGAIRFIRETLHQKQYTKLFVITDTVVESLYLERLKAQLPEEIETVAYTVPAGEKAKQFSVYEACLNFALQEGLDRKSCIIAFGGGAVGDLAGFVAATFMRGIDFIQVPTTILAHDSAVGGKTAINVTLGKNMVGAFHQPEAVIYDIDFLQSLPDSELRSGMAEVIKHALIADEELLHFLMNEISDIKNISAETYAYILKRGIEIKAGIVSEDERETGVRAYLNFGHTLGHAIEATAGYGVYTHGEAVMIGMVYALHISKSMLGLDLPLSSFVAWIRSLGYQVNLPETLDFETAFQTMQRDKKSIGSEPYFVLLEKIGQPLLRKVEKHELEKIFTEQMENAKI